MEAWLFFIGVFVIYLLFFKKEKPPNIRQTGINATKKNRISDHSPSSTPVRTVKRNASQYSHSVDDDDLATFTLIDGQLSEYIAVDRAPTHTTVRENKTKGRWVRPGESVTIQNIVINQGNFYYGGRLKSTHSSNDNGYYHDDSTEASLVNDALTICAGTRHYEDESLSYWPRFALLSPRCRGAYLDWLASDRCDASCPIGYVFIYFYGIERRILVDGAQDTVSDIEFRALFDEVKRLRSLFQVNHSFRAYSTRLIEVMSLLRPGVAYVEDKDELLSSESSLLFQYHLATTVEQGNPVPAELALAWVKYYTEYALRTPARRCADEFAVLFKQRYLRKFGAGLIVKPNKTRLKLEYKPASSTIRDVRFEQFDLPDPSVLRAPVQKLVLIAESCTTDLNAYSRYLGKKGTSRSDIAAVMLLPDEILSESAEQLIAYFRVWADEQINNHSGLASVAEFWSCLGISAPEKINKKEAELIQSFAQKAGYGVAPDTRYHHSKPEPDGYIVLFAKGHGEFFEPSAGFTSVSVALRLGALVAQIDNHVDASERDILQRLIDHDITFSPTEKLSLHAYLIWRLNTPANMAGLKDRIEKLSDNEKSAVGEIIVNVACADGKIASTEIKQLEKIYISLGLDSSLVTGAIHRFSTSKKMSSATSVTSKAGKEFSLNENILARHESETKDVHSLLNSIFVNNEPGEPFQRVSSVPQPTSGRLDEAHRQLYNQLSEKDKWARNEVMELCHQLGLMVNGAIETINDWSYEQVEAPVLDDDDDIYVDLEIAQELKG
ncbi:TerB N-terminal domain-containing protein [Edaphovirga cremea]|uniref:tellurite resistance TerB family protein n=1 Tax=Edaphovirga cremea TaxID=2267246 RepID=UPI000DEF1EE4|nr:TerB N-terminal domain-containing protein [Edaphovirga cremea]